MERLIPVFGIVPVTEIVVRCALVFAWPDF
jgi:hypothetical protein